LVMVAALAMATLGALVMALALAMDPQQHQAMVQLALVMVGVLALAVDMADSMASVVATTRLVDCLIFQHMD